MKRELKAWLVGALVSFVASAVQLGLSWLKFPISFGFRDVDNPGSLYSWLAFFLTFVFQLLILRDVYPNYLFNDEGKMTADDYFFKGILLWLIAQILAFTIAMSLSVQGGFLAIFMVAFMAFLCGGACEGYATSLAICVISQALIGFLALLIYMKLRMMLDRQKQASS